MDMLGDDEGSLSERWGARPRSDAADRDQVASDPLGTLEVPDASGAPAASTAPGAPEVPEATETQETPEAPAVPEGRLTALDMPGGTMPTAPQPPVTPTEAPATGAAQQFQDVIALRREAENAAEAALSERREATSQASRIIEEAMRAAETLRLESERDLELQRSAAQTEAAVILERARTEASEIIRAGEHDVLEAQRLRREAATERDQINAELERIRRTAQEELFAEANRHASRMEEIRTRVLHGVEAVTGPLRGPLHDPAEQRTDGGYGDAVTRSAPAAYLPPAPEPRPEAAAEASREQVSEPTPEPTPERTSEPTYQPSYDPFATNPPVEPAVTPGVVADPPPVEPRQYSTPVPPPSVNPSNDTRDEPDRGRRGWRSRRS